MSCRDLGWPDSRESRNSTGSLRCKKFCFQMEICLRHHYKRWRPRVSKEISMVDSKEDWCLLLFWSDCTAAHATPTKMTWEQNQPCSHLFFWWRMHVVPLQERCTTAEWRIYSLRTALLLYAVVRPSPSLCLHCASTSNITRSRERGKWKSPF